VNAFLFSAVNQTSSWVNKRTFYECGPEQYDRCWQSRIRKSARNAKTSWKTRQTRVIFRIRVFRRFSISSFWKDVLFDS
jgi:hypothetical protein